MIKDFLQFLFPSSDVERTPLMRDMWVNCTVEQKILWTAIMEKFHPKTIVPFYYNGEFTAGNCPFHFANYAAGTFYLALDFICGTSYPAIMNMTPMIEFFDENFVYQADYSECAYFLEAAGVNFWQRGNIIHIQNTHFGCVNPLAAYYETVKMIGYVITY
jgi:hypothetical protein